MESVEHLLAQGFIAEEDMKLLRVCDSADEVLDTVHKWQCKKELGGKKALCL
jgi:predicted Rossmann-fold nucleotide-binding protein